MFNKKELLKGILEGCILKIILLSPSYGYEIYSKLVEYGFDDLQMGTVYPILMRLQKKQLVAIEYSYSSKGPVRKMYQITKMGQEYYYSFKTEWYKTQKIVNSIIEEE